MQILKSSRPIITTLSLLLGILLTSVAMSDDTPYVIGSSSMESRSADGSEFRVLEEPRIEVPSLNVVAKADAGWQPIDSSNRINLIGNAVLFSQYWTAMAHEVSIDTAANSVSIEGTLNFAEKRPESEGEILSMINYSCSGGNLFVNGSNWGYVGPANAIPIAVDTTIHCNVDRIHMTIYPEGNIP